MDEPKCPHCGAKGVEWPCTVGGLEELGMRNIRFFACGYIIGSGPCYEPKPTRACTCDLTTLTASGCQCGAMAREREGG
jgi:hypothetical protein